LVAGVVIAARAAKSTAADPLTAPAGLGALAVFLLVSVFVMGMSFANDSTAGERERGSLEPLLLTRVPPISLVLGKWAAVVVFDILGFLLTLVCTLAILGVLNLGVPALERQALGL